MVGEPLIELMSDEELANELISIEDITNMFITVQDSQGNAKRIPDFEKQQQAHNYNRTVAIELNTRAVARQNEAGKLMTVWAEPTHLDTGNTNYDKFIHKDCDEEQPEGWVSLMISDNIRSQKCHACGYPLDKSLGKE